MKVPHDCFRSPRPVKKALAATVSAFCEPWFFPRFHMPTFPANCAVGVATKTLIFTRTSAWKFVPVVFIGI